METYIGNSIKKALLEGGIVIAPQRSGKTTALLEILAEDPEAIVVTLNVTCVDRLEYQFRETFGYPSKKIFSRKECIDYPRHTRFKKVFIDDYLFADFNEIPFFAAVSYPTHRVTVIKPDNEFRDIIMRSGQDLDKPSVQVSFCIF